MSEDYQLKRLPAAHHHSLKAWNAADELIIKELDERTGYIGVYNDAFGYLTYHLSDYKTFVITDLKSQKEAIQLNLDRLGKALGDQYFLNVLDNLPVLMDRALLKIPKSNALFDLYLQVIYQNLADNGKVFCGFMTKYFSNGLLKIAEKYFSSITQTRAEKKARVLILSGKKEVPYFEAIESFDYDGKVIQQYKGIFSGGKIDGATDYLLNNLSIPYNSDMVLDLASGNGVIGQWVLDNTSTRFVHFLDDSFLAVESSKLNVKSDQVTFHHHYQLSDIDDGSLDWIISNPPFHFGHTVDISVPLDLFDQAYQKLKLGGTLTIVANSNLGYEQPLKKQYRSVNILKSNHQYKIYECRK